MAQPRGAVPAVVSGAVFLAMLDATVANLVIPDLGRDMDSTSVADLSWVITAYAVPFAALLATAGRLADVLGLRTLFVAGIGLFTVTSLASALAPNLPTLIAARAVQGAGAAAMIPSALAILLHGARPEHRARAIGLWAAVSSMAAAVGPSLGGVLVDAFGWRSVFVINVPVGIALIAAAGVIPKLDPVTDGRARRVPDLVGTTLLVAGIGAAVLGVSRAETWGWGDARTAGCLLGGAAALAWALARSGRHPVPAVEVTLLRDRPLALANATAFLYGTALFSWLLVGVLFLTQVWGYSELEAGLAMSPGAVTAALSAVVAGRAIARRGVRPVVVTGTLVMAAAGVWTMVGLSDEPRFVSFWLPVGLLVGLGVGAAATGVAAAAALAGPPERFAAVTGLSMTSRQVGGALGVAVLASILEAGQGVSDYTDVYLFCTLMTGGAALTGLWLRVGARRPVPAARTPEPLAAGGAGS